MPDRGGPEPWPRRGQLEGPQIDFGRGDQVDQSPLPQLHNCHRGERLGDRSDPKHSVLGDRPLRRMRPGDPEDQTRSGEVAVKVTVIYESIYGNTAEIAEAIAEGCGPTVRSGCGRSTTRLSPPTMNGSMRPTLWMSARNAFSIQRPSHCSADLLGADRMGLDLRGSRP
jgi:hypothetical protein